MFETTRITQIERLAQYDSEAWTRLHEQFASLIQAYGRKAGLQDADIADVAQGVWQSLFTALPRFRYDPARGRFRDYLGRIAANAVRRHLGRRAKRAEQRLDTVMSQSLTQADDLDALWLSEWRNHHCRIAMSKLRRSLEAKSLVVFEALLDGSSIAQICTRYGMQREAVYKVRTRVRARLRALIRQQMANEDSLYELL